MKITPITLREANAYVERNHRHSNPVRGQKFSIAVSVGDQVRGVAIAGRPVNRIMDDGYTIEVLRVCTDGTKNACSKLYAACWRAARAMGYTRIITYTRKAEPGTSVAAAGFEILHETQGRSWNCESRPRVEVNDKQDKFCWARAV